jgi:hypothetical protein
MPIEVSFCSFEWAYLSCKYVHNHLSPSYVVERASWQAHGGNVSISPTVADIAFVGSVWSDEWLTYFRKDIAWLTTFDSLMESWENQLGPLSRKAGRFNLALSQGKWGDSTWTSLEESWEMNLAQIILQTTYQHGMVAFIPYFIYCYDGNRYLWSFTVTFTYLVTRFI